MKQNRIYSGLQAFHNLTPRNSSPILTPSAALCPSLTPLQQHWSPEYSPNMSIICSPRTSTLFFLLPETSLSYMQSFPFTFFGFWLNLTLSARQSPVTSYKSSSYCLSPSLPPHPSHPLPCLIFFYSNYCCLTYDIFSCLFIYYVSLWGIPVP